MIEERKQQWLHSPQVSKDDKATILAYEDNELNDAFFKDIEFGTAGMRGIMGPGTNRINTFTIQKVAYAFALYLKEVFKDQLSRGVVIGHDNRFLAKEFTHLTASILMKQGIHAYTFAELVPTPLLSYAVRRLHAIGGVMLTASHNPKEHNGFKVYDEHGCQLIPHKIDHVIRLLNTLPDLLDLVVPSVEQVGKIEILSSEVETQYLQDIQRLRLHPNLDTSQIKLVYSPQHGTGYRLVPTLFAQAGFQPLITVDEQMTVDPYFSSTDSPNPEDPRAYSLALQYAQRHQADLIMVSDPDADRVGLAYLDTQGNYQRLNGNLSGALLANYLFSQLRETGKMPINPIMYDTIVCSPFARQIASSYGVHVESFLTGFKFIGDRIQFYEQNAGPTFVFGYEESYGCLIGSFVRDKDALQALLMYAEMTLFYLTQGKRLNQVIDELFQSFGYHEDAQFSVALQGEEGQTFLSNLMQAIRSKPFQAIGSRNVVQFEDYFHQQKKTKDNQIFPIHLPQANVVKITYDDQSTVVIRPSGTEPKCKFYVSIVEKTPTNLLEKIEQLKHDFYAFYSINDR
jgi:phosphoglucomutase